MSVIVWPKTDAYRGETREILLSKLREALQDRCLSAWLFGSFARGEERSGSDIDLIIVAETSRPFIERPRDFDDLWSIFPALDLLVYTPVEFAQLLQSHESGFKAQLKREMVRLL